MSKIDGQTQIPLGVVIAVIVSICGLVGTASVAQFRVSDIDIRVTDHNKALIDHEKRIQRVEDAYATVSKMLDRIDAKLDEIAKRGP